MPISAELLDEIQRDLYKKEVLELKEKGIDNKEAEALANALKTNFHITKVNLYGNKIEDKGAIALAGVRLKELNLSCNKIGSNGASFLATSEIEFLDLSGNEINAEGAQYFSESKHILELSLSECGIGDMGAKVVLKNNHLKILDLSTNDITDEGLGEISGESALVELNLSQNDITAKGAKYISEHKTLENIDLSANSLGDDGAKLFSKNDKLLSLNLMQNGITAKGFSDIFKNNKRIQKLELFNNNIRFNEGDSLSVNSNSSLVELGLGYNHINSQCKWVLEALVSISTLETLDLVHNNIDDHGAIVLYQYAASKAKSLKKIDLMSNHVEAEALVKQGLDLKLSP